MSLTLWFTKSRRAQNKDDYETWIVEGVVPTLSAFDTGDGRETVIILSVNTHGQIYDICCECGNDQSTENQNYCMDCLESGAKELDKLANNVKDEKFLVRRLTPIECERLQGFPDNWTEAVSDSQRYRQMGNAVTVNVIEWIGAKL